MEKRLYRSRSERMVWGVCGGLAKYFDIDPTIIRIIFVVLIPANGLSILAYIIMAIIVPLEDSKAVVPKDAIKENVEEMKQTVSELGREIRSTFAGEEDKSEVRHKIHLRHRNLFGITLIVVGILLLLGSLNLFWWLRWGYLWPLTLVGAGVLIILSARGK